MALSAAQYLWLQWQPVSLLVHPHPSTRMLPPAQSRDSSADMPSKVLYCTSIFVLALYLPCSSLSRSPSPDANKNFTSSSHHPDSVRF
ncbi:hypothetical protein M431DRAFT_503649 [Trichoderma harzianum CBS 226.95]|uniref:Uncharacterized protein n=1 Tax=Trichoderma harzianum CBS 226.95 TaxID=983964 RepID=A0A2T4ANP5_TRIHA|nr:hypothetical protein M431DRAFT_503649 [Trichoderma harzianum CBS 226.95]PTB58687.1 hypothetical protein M431DRAFT_503649 [Trichoderma harzianum CBS 226.95]